MAVIKAGAAIRKDERQLMASRLFGTYSIRLRLAQALGRPGEVGDLALLVENLREWGDVAVDGWYIHAVGGVRFIVFENGQDGRFLGCLRGDVESHALK